VHRWARCWPRTVSFRAQQWHIFRVLLLRRYAAAVGNPAAGTLTPHNLLQALTYFRLPRTGAELLSRPHKYHGGGGGGDRGGGVGGGRYRRGGGAERNAWGVQAMEASTEAAALSLDSSDLAMVHPVPLDPSEIAYIDSLNLPPIALGWAPWRAGGGTGGAPSATGETMSSSGSSASSSLSGGPGGLPPLSHIARPQAAASPSASDVSTPPAAATATAAGGHSGGHSGAHGFPHIMYPTDASGDPSVAAVMGASPAADVMPLSSPMSATTVTATPAETADSRGSVDTFPGASGTTTAAANALASPTSATAAGTTGLAPHIVEFVRTPDCIPPMAALAAGLVSSRRYKTKLCHAYQLGHCPRGDKCDYAHGEEELRVQHDTSDGKFKTKMCRVWMDSCGGYCPFASKCSYAHGAAELRHPAFAAAAGRAATAGPSPVEARPGYGASTGSGAGGAGEFKPQLCRHWLRGAVAELARAVMTGEPPRWRTSSTGRGSSSLGCPLKRECPHAHGLDDLRLPPATLIPSCLHFIASEGPSVPKLALSPDAVSDVELFTILLASTLMVPVLPPPLVARIRARHAAATAALAAGMPLPLHVDDFSDLAPSLATPTIIAASSTMLPISMSATQHVDATSTLDITRIIAIVGAEACNAAFALALVQLLHAGNPVATVTLGI